RRARPPVSAEKEYAGRSPGADPGFEVFSDSDVLDFVGTVLVDFLPAQIETLLDHVAFGGPVSVVAQRWGTDEAGAGARIEAATQCLRAEFGWSGYAHSGAAQPVAHEDTTALVEPVGPVGPLTWYLGMFGVWVRDRRESLGWTPEEMAR